MLKVGDIVEIKASGYRGTVTKVWKTGGNVAGHADFEEAANRSGPVGRCIMRYALEHGMIFVVQSSETGDEQ